MACSSGVHGGIRDIEARAALLKLKAKTMISGISHSHGERDLFKVRVRNCLKVKVNGLG
jgi:hypothetical protein